LIDWEEIFEKEPTTKKLVLRKRERERVFAFRNLISIAEEQQNSNKPTRHLILSKINRWALALPKVLRTQSKAAYDKTTYK